MVVKREAARHSPRLRQNRHRLRPVTRPTIDGLLTVVHISREYAAALIVATVSLIMARPSRGPPPRRCPMNSAS